MQVSIIIPFIFYFLIVIGIGVYTTRFSSMGVSEFGVFAGFLGIGLGLPGNSHILVSLMTDRTKKKGHDHVESRP